MKREQTPRKPWVIGVMQIVVLVALISGVFYCIHQISLRNLSNQESTLLGLLLTLLSVFAGWLITHVYAEQQTAEAIEDVHARSRENLRTYALKASEKVNNLSNEFSRLATYLEEELAYSDYETPAEALNGREERIESAIHLIRTLKSVNDTALSDWEGVIGDELDEQREEQKEKEQELRLLIEKVEGLAENHNNKAKGSVENDYLLRQQLSDLRTEFRAVVSSLGVPGVPTISSKAVRKNKEAVHKSCPKCQVELVYRQRATTGGSKAVRCKSCASRFVSRYTGEGGFVLEDRGPKIERTVCPECSEVLSVLLQNAPGSHVVHECTRCAKTLQTTRTVAGINTKLRLYVAAPKLAKEEIDAAFIESVSKLLPAQPWPTGIHKTISATLGVRSGLVTDAIQYLIRAGRFMPQIDGVLYGPVATSIAREPDSCVERDKSAE